MTFVFLSFGFVSDFGFRVSEFVRSWRPLRRGIPTRPRSSCLPEALFHSGSPCGVLISTQAEYDPQGVTPRGESSFIRFPKPKFNGKFQICLVRLGRDKRLFCIMEGNYLKPEKSHRLGFQK